MLRRDHGAPADSRPAGIKTSPKDVQDALEGCSVTTILVRASPPGDFRAVITGLICRSAPWPCLLAKGSAGLFKPENREPFYTVVGRVNYDEDQPLVKDVKAERHPESRGPRGELDGIGCIT